MEPFRGRWAKTGRRPWPVPDVFAIVVALSLLTMTPTKRTAVEFPFWNEVLAWVGRASRTRSRFA